MKKYIAFFGLRMRTGLQYRTAAVAGLITQFVWGIMLVLGYAVFYKSNPNSFPMELSALCSYVWLSQAFLALLNTNNFEGELFEAVSSGGVAYEMCRPIRLYELWFARSMAHRLSGTMLRCLPVLLFAGLLPQPYGLRPPANLTVLLWTVLSLLLSLLVVVALTLLVYICTFYTVSSLGVRIFSMALGEFLSGALLPLPFFPEGVRTLVELLPFAALNNVPFRIYGGDIVGTELLVRVGLQLFWAVALVLLGRLWMARAVRQVALQGG